MNRLFVIAGLAILIVALVFLNQGIKKTGLSDDDAAPPPASAAQSAPAPKTAPGPPASPAPAGLPAEQTVGNPATAKHHIVVGWSYNEANQQKPDSLTTPLQAVQSYVQKSGGSVSAEIVNTDVPASDRSPAAQAVAGNGVFVDGKPVLKGDVSSTPPQKVIGAIQSAAK
jgi:hypothetical protein